MIIKAVGKAAHYHNISKHLANTQDNQKISLLSSNQGYVDFSELNANALKDAFQEMNRFGRSARDHRGLCHFVFNPPKDQAFSNSDFKKAMQIAFKGLGYELDKLDYVAIKHTKKGTSHVHLITTMRDEKGNRLNLHNITQKTAESQRQIAQQFGYQLPDSQRLLFSRKQDGTIDWKAHRRALKLAKGDIQQKTMQQHKRHRLDSQKIKSRLQELYANADTFQQFHSVCQQQGFFIGTGTKRKDSQGRFNLIVLDKTGTEYSLRRMLKIKQADIWKQIEKENLSLTNLGTMKDEFRKSHSEKELITQLAKFTQQKKETNRNHIKEVANMKNKQKFNTKISKDRKKVFSTGKQTTADKVYNMQEGFKRKFKKTLVARDRSKKSYSHKLKLMRKFYRRDFHSIDWVKYFKTLNETQARIDLFDGSYFLDNPDVIYFYGKPTKENTEKLIQFCEQKGWTDIEITGDDEFKELCFEHLYERENLVVHSREFYEFMIKNNLEVKEHLLSNDLKKEVGLKEIKKPLRSEQPKKSFSDLTPKDLKRCIQSEVKRREAKQQKIFSHNKYTDEFKGQLAALSERHLDELTETNFQDIHQQFEYCLSPQYEADRIATKRELENDIEEKFESSMMLG